MRKAGWFRLWVLLTVIGVPAATLWQSERQQRSWDDLDKLSIHNCVEAEWSDPTHPDAIQCGLRAGVDKTMFEREGTTPLRYWSEALGLAFLADLVITGLIVVSFQAIRWVARGFRPEISR